ncbi:MAG TPA: hypothetical protein VL485_19385 [Ktedonobacteraceae bacterium]|jgi:hypothetical protein|nr:hypothetical protein [Ktedonobacteraceae bacterium]
MAHISVASEPVEGLHATSAEPAGPREFPDAMEARNGVPTGLGSGANGCDV